MNELQKRLKKKITPKYRIELDITNVVSGRINGRRIKKPGLYVFFSNKRYITVSPDTEATISKYSVFHHD